MYRILSISENVRLLLARNDILAVAGFSVISPKHPEQAVMLAAREQVDGVVIGHSVESRVRAWLIRDLRRVCPNCVICFVYAAPEKTGEPLADISVDVTGGPEPLITALQDRLPERLADAS